MRRLPRRVARADDVDVEAVRVRRLAARGAVEDRPCPARRSNPSISSCRQATPQARMIVLRAQDVAAVEVHLRATRHRSA